jgi:hypothetical protein
VQIQDQEQKQDIGVVENGNIWKNQKFSVYLEK